MSSSVTVDNFLATLQKSNLLTDEQWGEVRAYLRDSAPLDAATVTIEATAPARKSPRRDIPGPLPSAAEFAAAQARVDVPDLIQWLIGRGWLTRWQADMLLTGRRAFFLGKYKLLDRIGVGGMGAVFKAEHVGLGRVVAIKIMSPALVRNKAAIARFYREMQAAAALNHPNIVLAFDAGALGDTHFLVMEYVDGADLGTLVDRGNSLPIGWACECIRQAALGLQHACERGMVHRDIKPSNLLVTRDPDSDRPLVKVLDMGLARFVSESGDDRSLTQTGQVLGTPDYISPEQAADTRHADIRSDIFSLGITFFRLLTGKLPFKGENVMEKLMARAMGDAPPIRALRPDIPPALAAVIARMLARDIRQRFQTPQEVVEALAPFAMPAPLDQLLALAGPAPPPGAPPGNSEFSPPDLGLERFLKQLATEAERGEAVDPPLGKLRSTSPAPAVADRVPPGVPAVAGASAKTSPLAPPKHAPRPWRPTQTQRVTLGLLLSAALLAVAAGTWFLRQDRGQAQLSIDWPPAQRRQAALQINGQPVAIPADGPLRHTAPAGAWKIRLERDGFEPIETTLALASGDQQTWSPDWRTAAELTRRATLARLQKRLDNGPSTDPAAPGTVSLRQDFVQFIHQHPGTAEARAASQLLPRLNWPLDALQRSQIPPADLTSAGFGEGRYALRELVSILGDGRLKHWNSVYDVAVNAGNRLLAASSLDGTVKIWDVATGRDLHTLLVADSRATLLFSPSGNLLAVSGEAGRTFLWDVQTGSQQAPANTLQRAFAFSPNGQLLLGSGRGRRLGLWNVPGGEERQAFAVPEAVTAAVFSPDGNRVVAETRNGVLVYDAASAALRHQFAPARSPLFNPGSTRLAAETASSAVTLWDLEAGKAVDILEDAGRPLGFRPDGRVLASARYGRVILWDLDESDELSTLLDLNGLTRISPDGRHVADADDDFGWLKFRDTTTLETRAATGHSRAITCLAFTPDSSLLVTGSADHAVKFWHPATGAERVVAGAGIATANLNADGRLLAVATEDGSIRLREIQSGRTSRVLQDAARRIETLRFSPNGQVLAAVADWGVFQVSLRLWETASGRELDLIGDQPGAVHALAFSADSSLLAVAGNNRTVSVWDLESRRLRFSLPEFTGRIHALAFSPDQHWLAVGGEGQPLLLWDLRQQTAGPVLSTPNGAVHDLAFSPDGRTLAQAGAGEQVVLWDLRSRRPLSRAVRVPGFTPRTLTFSLDGDWLAASGHTGKVHLWNMAGEPLGPNPQRTIVVGPPGGIVDKIQFSPEGRHLLTCNGNGTVYVLRLPSEPEDSFRAAP